MPRTKTGARRAGLTAALVLAGVSVALTVGPVSAYDGNAAATWADNQALNANCQISPCFTNDCAGFVSQSLHFGGGYPYYGVGSDIHDYHYWWIKWVSYAGWSYSDSWGGVIPLYNFQMVHIPGGTDYGGVVPGLSHISSGRVKGDLFFYDWTNNGSLDHVTIMVGNGTDPNQPAWVGDLVDAHSQPHYHGYWTLAPYNSNALVTRIQRVHIYATN